MKPATPLPWVHWQSRPTNTDEIQDRKERPVVRWTGFDAAHNPNRAHKDASYIVRAANAYPKLVAALKAATDTHADRYFAGDGKPPPCICVGCELLRDLGESSSDGDTSS